jgi:UDP-glucose 4-epimerase
MRALVTGGAGYIGSHMVKLLVESGAEVTVLDDLSTGHAEAVRGAKLVRGDITDVAATKNLLAQNGIEAVVHFAASSLVGESVADPLKYYRRAATHLIPLVLQAAAGRRPSISVFGNDWPTRDGTCVRDYIHVSDLCVAHLLALDWLAKGGRYACFNLGNGDGATVLEVIEAARHVTGKTIKMVQAERRAGDPPSLVAEASKAREVLGWQPARADIEGIVRDAWNYEQRRAT